MKKLYATVEINKKNSKSRIKYYEIQEEKYGVEIVREANNKVLRKRVIDNITEHKSKIYKILDILIKNLVTPETAEYIENDIVV